MSGKRLAIIGDGKMGRAVRDLALESGWQVSAFLGERESDGGRGITAQTLGKADVAVEFTEPGAAVANVSAALRAGIPVVVGTTGWYDALPEIKRVAEESRSAVLWAANFSVGVNVMLELAARAGELMRGIQEFDAHIVETHHAKKKDAPSGTAIAIARATSATLGREIPTTSVRTGSVPGTHELIFDGGFEQLTISHVARDRRVFAEGALRAAAWLIGRHGVFTMSDVLKR